MTATLADHRRFAIEVGCGPWLAKAIGLIKGQIADAKAHAGLVINKSLIATPDGRPTAARANQSRSMMSAESRMAELVIALAGPSTRSLDGLIRDAWADCYKVSWMYYKSELGPEYCTDAVHPSKAEFATVRGMILGGSDARTRVLAATDPALRRLRVNVVKSASPTVDARDRLAFLNGWERATSDAVKMAARNAIVTGAFRADILAGRAVIRPDLLHDDPTISGA